MKTKKELEHKLEMLEAMIETIDFAKSPGNFEEYRRIKAMIGILKWVIDDTQF